jgi:hypothetical protein
MRMERLALEDVLVEVVEKLREGARDLPPCAPPSAQRTNSLVAALLIPSAVMPLPALKSFDSCFPSRLAEHWMRLVKLLPQLQ